ncbi:3-oxoacyl-ACP reductase family protein [Breoghania sp. L-A4]|uniref:SDR family NAD(P)-dependent oxidoreductase n=1 Tax=Breoghania sp. L-A4 TaxID=2304600 RepID=UPI000E35FB62|nr:3-oxoacyl-ACP reductase family protein [Breoghania sp. L-A4]AXS41559.1 3-oxoacyl-ACP reductase FabG [Breoghania sp. L-A4]
MSGSLSGRGSLAGRTALVTGGSRGIGRAIALAFAREGANVAICHRDDTSAEKVIEELRAAGAHAIEIVADVSREDPVLAMFAEIAETFGTLDVAVSNAGILREAPLLETSAADFDAVVAVNLRGSFLVCREAARMMLARPETAPAGRIITISSDLAFLGREEMSAYSASKGGIVSLTRSLARELAPRILVNAIAPGPVDTDMTSAETMSAEALAKDLATPLARLARPEEIADLAVFLAGDGSSFVTGQCYGANGGSAMY